VGIKLYGHAVERRGIRVKGRWLMGDSGEKWSKSGAKRWGTIKQAAPKRDLERENEQELGGF